MCRTFVRVWTIDVCFEMYPLFHLLFVVLLLELRVTMTAYLKDLKPYQQSCLSVITTQ